MSKSDSDAETTSGRGTPGPQGGAHPKGEHARDSRACIDAGVLRRLAADGDVDPRSLLKLLRGEAVKGMAGRRARKVLMAAGLLRRADDKEPAQ